MRQYGQRSIVSLFSSSIAAADTRQPGAQASLLEFLDRKHPTRKPAVPQQTSLDLKDVHEEDEEDEHVEEEDAWASIPAESVSDSLMRQRLSRKKISARPTALSRSAKRRRGLAERQDSSKRSKRLLVLGDDPNPHAQVRFMSICKPQVIYNHYCDGGGFWNQDMVGLDGELGSTCEWEGVGTTSLGQSSLGDLI